MDRRQSSLAKLTISEVREIRRQYEEDRVSQGALARAFGMSVVQIGRIVRYESWRENATVGTRTLEQMQRQSWAVMQEMLAKAEPAQAEQPAVPVTKVDAVEEYMRIKGASNVELD